MLVQRLERLGHKIALCACEAMPRAKLPHMMCRIDSAVPVRICIQKMLLRDIDTCKSGAAHWACVCVHVPEKWVSKAVRRGTRTHLMKDQLLITSKSLAACATL